MTTVNPQNAKEYYERGNERYENRDYDGAIADYNESLMLNPDNAQTLSIRGLAWSKKGEHEKADFDPKTCYTLT